MHQGCRLRSHAAGGPEGLTDQGHFFPPQISSEFITRMSESLGIVREKFVDVVDGGKDLFTSSLPHTLRRAQETNQVQNGDIGLIINVGSGIQVGCAIYYF